MLMVYKIILIMALKYNRPHRAVHLCTEFYFLAGFYLPSHHHSPASVLLPHAYQMVEKVEMGDGVESRFIRRGFIPGWHTLSMPASITPL